MTQIRLATKLNQIIANPSITTLRIYQILETILGILGLSVLAAALYLAPQPATLGLVLIGLGLPIMLLLWRRPEFGLLALIFLTSSIVPIDIVDLRLPIGGGLDLQDLVLVGMLGLLILRGLFYKTLSIRWWHVGVPLLVFLGFAIFSTLYALFYQHVESNWALSDLRALTYYCIFFVTDWAINHKRQLATVLVGLFILADLIAGILILQQFLGPNHFLFTAMSYSNWRVYDLQQTGGIGKFGMVRIMPPGATLVYFMMIMAVCLMVFTPHNWRLRAIFALQFICLNFGLLLTYTRALWIAAAGALGLVLIALFPVYKAYLIRYLVIGIPMLGLLFGILGVVLEQNINEPELITASIERALSILKPGETLESDSLQWRVFETKEGMRSVLEHPLIGVGLGNYYRKITTLQGEANGWLTGQSLAAGKISRFTRFIHSSYLSIAVKMGLPALVCFLWFCVSLVINSALLYKNLSEGLPRAIALTVLTSFIGLMFWSVFHHHFIQTESTAIVGLIAGLAACLYRGVGGQNDLEQISCRVYARLRS